MSFLPGLEQNPLIKSQLKKHVVNRRSIIFLLDTKFPNCFYHKQANLFMQRMFHHMDDEESFGYICVGNKEDMPCHEL
jgi:hypothetical protein